MVISSIGDLFSMSDNSSGGTSVDKNTGVVHNIETEFHCMHSCNKCGGENEVTSVDVLESYGVSEASTICKDCGFEDYWAYGFFESGSEGFNSCSKY